uniref:VWFA domain-containing protein n=1 Tax=Anisakis simplex TaxID=6269 RepID=A0A0M3J2S4_ANISI
LLMDFSGGVDNKRDDYVKLASSLVKNLHLGPFNAQIAMIRYSGPGRTETIFHLNKYTNASAAIEEMKRVPHMGGTTRTGEAITYATGEFDQRYGARKGAKRLIIIFTDGYSQEDPSDAALEARKSGIEIDAVAVEDDLVPPDMDQLVMIANGISNVYMASKFEKLMSRVMDPLRKCK